MRVAKLTPFTGAFSARTYLSQASEIAASSPSVPPAIAERTVAARAGPSLSPSIGRAVEDFGDLGRGLPPGVVAQPDRRARAVVEIECVDRGVAGWACGITGAGGGGGGGFLRASTGAARQTRPGQRPAQ